MLDGAPDLPVEGKIWLQIAAKPSVLCCYLVSTNKDLGGLATAVLPFAKLLWFLLYLFIGLFSVAGPNSDGLELKLPDNLHDLMCTGSTV